MLRSVFLAALLLAAPLLYGQVIPPGRRTPAWQQAGYGRPLPTPSRILDIRAYGGVGDGRSSTNTALTLALAALGGRRGVILFPAGTYQFSRPLVLPDSVVLRGQGADSTTLRFDLNGAPADLISVRGSLINSSSGLTASAAKDSTTLLVGRGAAYRVGEWLLLRQNDTALVTSSWARGSVGQLVHVRAIRGNRLYLASPLRKAYQLADQPTLWRLNVRREVGIECLRIKRAYASFAQTSNIWFRYATNCWVRGVESDTCSMAHVSAAWSSNVSITGSYFHHAFNYGAGGLAYGVVLEYATGECLVEDNVFDHLRHSVLLQAGANGNVVAYNSSTNPTTTTFPTNLTGDLVLHGNYPYQNLFEGNLAQTIVVDNSHGANGPYNTFFRNRADLYGLSVSAATSGSQNFVGNEITNTAAQMGNYLLTGPDHLEAANYVRGSLLPAGSATLTETSYYLTGRPAFFPPAAPWPSVGAPAPPAVGMIPARQRAIGTANPTVCAATSPLGRAEGPSQSTEAPLFLPNPALGAARLHHAGGPVRVTVLNLLGQRVAEAVVAPGEPLPLTGAPAGVYLVRIADAAKRTTTQRLVWAP